ncbi:cobalt ABC transporter permease [Phaeobacter sp.]|uniref:cobalt ABC transporter permease n=1 Tax=Phaeobacter sp. TaxID=1902409 RepID=UPI0025EE4146|nr:cobalt ABC transporter permease [Phaeobacter sp.]
MLRVICLALASLLPSVALAHNVITSVFPSGQAIEGEVGFSNGDMAGDLLIEVFDDAGAKLGETRTDADGFFLFTPEQPVTHVFRGDLGAGHLAEVTMAADEVALILGTAPKSAPVTTGQTSATLNASASAAGLSDQARAEIATMLRTELRPLRQELTAYRNSSDLQSILGGIGYIFGLFGVGFYLAARRKLEG